MGVRKLETEAEVTEEEQRQGTSRKLEALELNVGERERDPVRSSCQLYGSYLVQRSLLLTFPGGGPAAR